MQTFLVFLRERRRQGVTRAKYEDKRGGGAGGGATSTKQAYKVATKSRPDRNRLELVRITENCRAREEILSVTNT
jgi:hypothetical protein